MMRWPPKTAPPHCAIELRRTFLPSRAPSSEPNAKTNFFVARLGDNHSLVDVALPCRSSPIFCWRRFVPSRADCRRVGSTAGPVNCAPCFGEHHRIHLALGAKLAACGLRIRRHDQEGSRRTGSDSDHLVSCRLRRRGLLGILAAPRSHPNILADCRQHFMLVASPGELG